MTEYTSTESRRERWLPEALAGLALLALVLLFNPGLAFAGHVLGGYDAFVYFYPLRSYIAETLGQGYLPLWNPYLFAGTPYLANPQTAVFYPGTWLFALLDVPRAYAVNFLAHLWIAALSTYAFARISLGLGRVAGVLGGAGFAFSGFMNGQAGHINQFSVAAWLPAVMLLLDLTVRRPRLGPFLGLVVVIALQVLAGHPQEVYMTMVAVGIMLLWRVVGGWQTVPPWVERLRLLLTGGIALGVAAGLAGGISAAQLLPTLELSGLSIRGGGLSYQLAAFDALPWPLLLPSLFPGYWAHLPTTEFFGHLGTALFALAWLGLLVGSGRPAVLGAVLVTLGLLLAVGDATSAYRFLFDYAPGFSSFRVPARWLMVSTVGLAILAAAGLDRLVRWRDGGRTALTTLLGEVGRVRRLLVGVAIPLALLSLVFWGQPQSKWLLLAWGVVVGLTMLGALLAVTLPKARTPLLVLLVGGALLDLWLAGANLEHRQTIPNIAYKQSREATTELLARAAAQPGYRSLSIASTEYVVKETGEYEERYGGLRRLALDNLLFAVKWNETLWPNVPLEYRLRSADGYDGGVLPLRTYYQFAQAMLGERARPDGVLISRLDAAPEPRWLDLLGVRWILAGRVKDDTRGAVYYDRALTRVLRPGESLVLGALPRGGLTKLGIISSVASVGDARAFVRGNDVAILRLTAPNGSVRELPLTVGRTTAPETWKPEQAPDLDRVERWGDRGPDAPGDWIAEVEFPRQEVAMLEIRSVSPERILNVRALNLIDDERQMAFPITPDSTVERVDFFDVKLYERQTALPRAYLVTQAEVLDLAEASTRLSDPAHNPRTAAILAPSETVRPPAASPAAGSTVGQAHIERDDPERVAISVSTAAPSILVLSDSWFPGWRATVDGQDVPIERANILFRAVQVPAGQHTVEFIYQPRSVQVGLAISGGSLLLAVVLAIGASAWVRPRRLPTPGETTA
ncbi:MAG: YfhO family protein [Chloroflexi bacterium]|nr:YfhO family protein [Chloroflexota bacterium]